MIPVKFSIINELGEEYALENVESGLLVEAAGIGGKKTNVYSQISNTWILNSSKSTQPNITGAIVLHGDSVYQKEAELVSFLRRTKEMQFKVTTPVTTKLMDVDMVSYELISIGSNTLQCPIEMVGKSLWYTKQTQKASIEAVEGNEVRYTYRFPSTFNDYANGKLEINNDGGEEAAFTVEMYGPIANPVITIEVDGSEYAKAEIDGSCAANERIIYSSRDGDLYCFKGTDEQIEGFKRNRVMTGLVNLTLDFDLENDNFFKIPRGYSELIITADSTLSNTVNIEIFKYYRTV